MSERKGYFHNTENRSSEITSYTINTVSSNDTSLVSMEKGIASGANEFASSIKKLVNTNEVELETDGFDGSFTMPFNTAEISKVFFAYCNSVVRIKIPDALQEKTTEAVYRRWVGATSAEYLLNQINDDQDPQTNGEIAWAIRRILYDSADDAAIDIEWINRLSLQLMGDKDEERRNMILQVYINQPRLFDKRGPTINHGDALSALMYPIKGILPEDLALHFGKSKIDAYTLIFLEPLKKSKSSNKFLLLKTVFKRKHQECIRNAVITKSFKDFYQKIMDMEPLESLRSQIEEPMYRRWVGAMAVESLIRFTYDETDLEVIAKAESAIKEILLESANTKNASLVDMDWVDKLGIQVSQDSSTQRRRLLLSRYINNPRIIGQEQSYLADKDM